MKATTARTHTVGFGCPTTDWPHHFAITIPRDRCAPVERGAPHGLLAGRPRGSPGGADGSRARVGWG